MDTIKSYKDLCKEIEIWESRIESYQAQIKALNKLAKMSGPTEVRGIDYTQPNVQGSGQISFEDYLIRSRRLKNHIFLHEEALKTMKESRNKIKNRLKGLEGLDKKVCYKRDIEDKSLVDIAKELGYSYDYIKEVSARNKNPL